MFDYDSLSRHPAAFRGLTGMDRAAFDALHEEFAAAEARRRRESLTTKRGGPRRRAAGGGPAHRNDGRGRLLMALVWLRVYPTYDLLGYFFGLHRRNAQLNARAALAVLESLHGFDFDRPGPGRRKLSTPAQVMDAFPAVRLVIDTKEQRCARPGGGAAGSFEAQKPYYSGKKKCHTLKTQIGVGPDGLIESVSDSHPGGATHDATLLRRTGLLDRLDHAGGEAWMADKGYDPLRTHYPGRPMVQPAKARRGHPLTDEQKAANQVIARYRVVVEHSIAQMNRFAALRQVFRGRVANHPRHHSQAVRVVAGLVNRRTRVCPLKACGKVA